MPEIVRASEVVSIPESCEELLTAFQDAGIDAFVPPNLFGYKRLMPSAPDILRVGGSVSAAFAIPAILLARQLCETIRYIHLTVDSREHYTMPELADYQVSMGFANDAVETYKLQAWSTADFKALRGISALAEFHYFVRNFYKKSDMIKRGSDATLVKYLGGIHDGQTLRMEGPPEVIATRELFLRNITRQDGAGIDIYEPKVNGTLLEMRFVRTVRP